MFTEGVCAVQMLTFPEKGFGLSVRSSSPSVVCNAASNPLRHFAATDRRKVQITQHPAAPPPVNRWREDGEIFSPSRTNVSDNFYFTSLSCSTLTGAETQKNCRSVFRLSKFQLRKVLLLPTFNNVLLLLPSHGQVLAFLLLHLEETLLVVSDSRHRKDKLNASTHTYRNPPTSFMASSICLSSS